MSRKQMMTSMFQYAPGTFDAGDGVEDALAALTPTAKDILAGVSSSDAVVRSTLLSTMPSGTASLLISVGVLTEGRELTDLGADVAAEVAADRGAAPDAHHQRLAAKHIDAARMSAAQAGVQRGRAMIRVRARKTAKR